jgi:ABC-2 type transport system ATP-binding protein
MTPHVYPLPSTPSGVFRGYRRGVTNVISMTGVVKRFGSTTALDGLDLSVAEGEVHGFLGPNGAGKTTTLRVLLGLLRIEAGEVSVLGMDPWRDAVSLHRRLAYVPGDVSLWPNLTGGEVIDLLGRLRGGLNEQRRAELIEMFDLDPTKKTRTYSKGNRQKVALISALSSDVELLLLDEPTAGLDPLMESMLRGVISAWRGDGRSVLLSSHILSEAEALSDRLSIIRAGRVVETGTLAQMRHLLRTSVTAVLRSEPDGLTALDGLHDVVVDGTTVTCQADAEALDGLLKSLTAVGVVSLTTAPPSLEQVFLQHYGKT